MIVYFLTQNGHADLISKQLPQNPRSSLNLIHVIANPILTYYFKMLNVTQTMFLFLKNIGIIFQKMLFGFKDINI